MMMMDEAPPQVVNPFGVIIICGCDFVATTNPRKCSGQRAIGMSQSIILLDESSPPAIEFPKRKELDSTSSFFV
jgi:hypothetical protein